MRKLRLLAWNDSPLSVTGFGVVAKNILGRIYKTGRFNVACVGINYFDEHIERIFEDRSEVPYKVTIGQDIMSGPGGTFKSADRMGRAKTIQILRKEPIDVFFMMRDLWDMVFPNVEGQPHLSSYFPLHLQLIKEQGKNFRTLVHFPLEYKIQDHWRPMLDMIDYGYCFTASGMEQLRAWSENISWCPQGADSKTFRPLENFDKNKFKKERMRLDPGSFIVLNVNRNQPKKDVESTAIAFRQMLEQCRGKRKPILWMHMRPDDNFGDARKLMEKHKLKVDEDVFFPPYFNVGAGWNDEELNMLYNTADVFVSTSLAEGFGLCVDPDTQIDTELGIKPMRDIQIGDRVLTEDGTHRQVEAKTERPVDYIYEFTLGGNEKTRVTAEHPFWAIRASDLRINQINTTRAEWIRADELKPKDMIGTPIPKLGTQDDVCLDIFRMMTDDEPYLCCDSNNQVFFQSGYSPITGQLKRYPNQISLEDPDLMEFFGWFLAEGSTPNGTTLEFSLGSEDSPESIRLIEHSLYKLGIGHSTRRIDNKVNIVGCSKIHSLLFRKLFGCYAANKRLPAALFRKPTPKLLGRLLRGLFLGDGTIKDQSTQLHSSSRELIGQIRTMLMSVRIPSIISQDPRTGVYDLTVCRQGYQEFAKLCGEDLIPSLDSETDRTARRFIFDEDNTMAFIRIRDIREVEYNDIVMDIKVQDVHSFVGNGYLLHNTPVEAGMAGCPTLVPGHTGFLQTMGHLGMPYIKTRTPERREKIGPSEVTPTDINDMTAKLLEHYHEPKKLRQALKKNLKAFRKMFDWDNIFSDYWEPALEVIEKDILETELRQKKNKDRVFFVCEEAAGDIIGASMAMDSIKKKYPDMPLDFMCKDRFQGIQKGNPDIDTYVDWDINKLFDYPKENVFYPHATIRHGSWSNGPYHLMDMQAHMAGVAPGEPYLNTEEFDLLLDDMNAEAPFTLITIQTTSQGGKMLAPDKWNEIIANVLQRYPKVRFLTVGGKNDMMVHGSMDFRGLPWEQQAWLQSKAFCHIGIDSSGGHFASVVGQPSIIFWGWTNSAVCRPKKHAINISAHYPSVCPRLGPCHGVQPNCGVNQYDTRSAMGAPCVRSIDVRPAVEIVCEALGKGDEGREWMKDLAGKQGLIFSIPDREVKK